VAKIIDNGTDAPGTILSMCSPEFMDIYQAAPLVIAKGQANYESLSSAGSKVFCLLQIKCPVISKDIGAPVGGIVIRQSTIDLE
jgi:damage-control phosphatase, subfamily I